MILFAITGLLTPECDIYSFGVVLLELLSGRPSIDPTKYGDECDLVAWVQPLSRDTRRLVRFMDPRLEENYSKKGAYLTIMLGLQCIGEARLRPTPDNIIDVINKYAHDEFHDSQYPFAYDASASESASSSESTSLSNSVNSKIVVPSMSP